MFLDFPIKSVTSDSKVRLYSTPQNKLVYEVLVPGAKKSDIKLLKTSKGIDVKVSYPTYPTRTYKFPVLNSVSETYSLNTFQDIYDYESSSLEDGILSIVLTKKESSSEEISW